MCVEAKGMRAHPRFRRMPPEFWAYVRLLSQEIGYTNRATRGIKVPTLMQMEAALTALDLDASALVEDGVAGSLGEELVAYFEHRASTLEERVEPMLMDATAAAAAYAEIRNRYPHGKAPQPLNKQKGDKRAPAFLTGMVNLIVEAHVGDVTVDYDPRGLTSITKRGRPFRTLARRVDGAFPRRVDPIAVWEIKEYYYTTTFGSRVADGVYETLLDGTELAESASAAASLGGEVHPPVEHVLFIDSHFTWWMCGRSYLCRLVDMLHMGLVTEVIFGREVIERLPVLVRRWVAEYEARGASANP